MQVQPSSLLWLRLSISTVTALEKFNYAGALSTVVTSETVLLLIFPMRCYMIRLDHYPELLSTLQSFKSRCKVSLFAKKKQNTELRWTATYTFHFLRICHPLKQHILTWNTQYLYHTLFVHFIHFQSVELVLVYAPCRRLVVPPLVVAHSPSPPQPGLTFTINCLAIPYTTDSFLDNSFFLFSL